MIGKRLNSAFTAFETALPRTVHDIRANLHSPMAKTYLDFGRLMFGGLAQYFERDVPGIFASVKDPQLQSEFAATNRNAVRELRSMDEWFAAQRATANEDFALGAELFQKMLYATERSDAGSTATTPCALIRRSVISRLTNSSSVADLNQRKPSVTNHVDKL
jgi:hypothetical protein